MKKGRHVEGGGGERGERDLRNISDDEGRDLNTRPSHLSPLIYCGTSTLRKDDQRSMGRGLYLYPYAIARVFNWCAFSMSTPPPHRGKIRKHHSATLSPSGERQSEWGGRRAMFTARVYRSIVHCPRHAFNPMSVNRPVQPGWPPAHAPRGSREALYIHTIPPTTGSPSIPQTVTALKGVPQILHVPT